MKGLPSASTLPGTFLYFLPVTPFIYSTLQVRHNAVRKATDRPEIGRDLVEVQGLEMIAMVVKVLRDTRGICRQCSLA